MIHVMLKRKWRVDVRKTRGSWRLDVDSFKDGWDRYHTFDTWRLTPSILDGTYVRPVLWFKPLKERVRIAVSWAVATVVRVEGLDKRSIEVERLASELNKMATKMFEETISKAVKAKENAHGTDD